MHHITIISHFASLRIAHGVVRKSVYAISIFNYLGNSFGMVGTRLPCVGFTVCVAVI